MEALIIKLGLSAFFGIIIYIVFPLLGAPIPLIVAMLLGILLVFFGFFIIAWDD